MNRTLGPSDLIFVLILAIVFIPGCVATQTALPIPPGPPVEAIGQAEFELAVQEYRKENYTQAIRSFMNLIQRYPGAPILAETQWMLAKSYEAQGDDRLALEEYQRFMKNYPGSDHLYEAKLRTDVLRQTVRPPAFPVDRGTIHAIQFASPAYVSPEAFESTIRLLSGSGINALIIPISRSSGPLPGVFFKTDRAPVIQDLLGSVVALAHDYKMRVFISVPLREAAWLKDEKWLDLKFDPASRSFKTSRHLNLWDTEVQNYLLSFYLDLAAYSFDGLIIEEPVGYSENEGFNQSMMKQFNKDFGLSLAPFDIYTNSPSTPAFWRWAGWKNRQVMAVLRNLIHELHLKQPQLQIGLALSNEAVVMPKEALVKYGQDLLEAGQAGFDFFALSWPPKSDRSGGTVGLLKRLKDFVPDQEKIIFRVDPASLVDAMDLAETAGFSHAFLGSGGPSEWAQGLPSAVLRVRPSP